VLLEIDELNKERCEACIESDAKGSDCECDAAESIRKLGKKLLSYTKPRNEQEWKLLNELKFENMTTDHYVKIREAGIKDVAMRKKLGVTVAMLYNWKKDNGLIAKRSVGV